MAWRDEWPCDADGLCYDGKELWKLVREGRSPFGQRWSVQQLVQEIEEHVGVEIVDIPIVMKGSNNYGLHFRVADGRELVARLARGDVNMPDFDGFHIDRQRSEVEFEAATYHLLRPERAIRPSVLLYYRLPVPLPGPKLEVPKNTSGRRLLVFEKARGHINVWRNLGSTGKVALLNELACIREALFNFKVPSEFASLYLRERLFEDKVKSFSVPVDASRAFWMHVIIAKIEATIGNAGDMIGWEDDNETVGSHAIAAKQSLLRVLPFIMPAESPSSCSFYRFVLEHGDFGIHNTTIEINNNGLPHVTSLFDWETGHIVPALLSDPLVAVDPVDLCIDESGTPIVARIPEDATLDELEVYSKWTQQYVKRLYADAPDLMTAIHAGRHLRHLWFALRDWRGGQSEEFFGKLGTWAEEVIEELSRSSVAPGSSVTNPQ